MNNYFDYKNFKTIKNSLQASGMEQFDDRTKPNYYSEPHYKVNYIDDDGYLNIDFVGGPKGMVDGPDFTYKINSHGYRSQHFKNLNSSSTNILFGGCSWTFGEGLPEDYTWTKLVTDGIQNLNKNKKVESFNMGYMGFSIDLIIKNIMGFIKNYGKPDYLFIVFPDFARQVKFDPYNIKYIKTHPNIHWIRDADDKAQKEYTLGYHCENNMYSQIQLIHMLEEFCEASKIKLIWTTWHTADFYVYNNIDFMNCFSPDLDENGEVFRFHSEHCNSKFPFYKNKNDWPYWGYADDKAHPGTAWTKFISEQFIKRIKK